MLEPVCCKNRQKRPNQETGLGNQRPIEALNNTNLVSLRTFICPLFPKPVSWLGFFLPFLTEKPALVPWTWDLPAEYFMDLYIYFRQVKMMMKKHCFLK